MEVKKVVYTKLVVCKDEDEKQTNKKIFKTTKMEAKLTAMAAKMTTFKRLYVNLEEKYADKKLYMLTKARKAMY